jgi:hypothetical protein
MVSCGFLFSEQLSIGLIILVRIIFVIGFLVKVYYNNIKTHTDYGDPFLLIVIDCVATCLIVNQITIFYFYLLEGVYIKNLLESTRLKSACGS